MLLMPLAEVVVAAAVAFVAVASQCVAAPLDPAMSEADVLAVFEQFSVKHVLLFEGLKADGLRAAAAAATVAAAWPSCGVAVAAAEAAANVRVERSNLLFGVIFSEVSLCIRVGVQRTGTFVAIMR